MLSCNPNTRFNSLPLNQLTAYVFCATAKDSPPILKKEGRHERKHVNCNTEAIYQLLAVLQRNVYVEVDLMHICKAI